LAKENTPTEKIGLILRDKHGIPKAKILGKKISQILKDAKIETRPEKEKILEKIGKLKMHLEKNKHDYPTQRAITKMLWALHREEKEVKN